MKLDLLACFWLKGEKRKDEPRFSFRAVGLIPWERKQECEGEVGHEVRERGCIWQEAGFEHCPMQRGLNPPEPGRLAPGYRNSSPSIK